MNRFNNLHLLGVVFLLALAMLYLTVRTEGRIADAATENSKSEQLGKKIMQMKKTWDDAPAQTQRRIDRLLAGPVFKPYVAQKEKVRDVYRVKLRSVPAGHLDQLTTKLLNDTVPVKQLQIVRNSDKNVSMTVEFSL
jgi:hypothetical protein